jgi:hypothetical protein
MSDPMESIDPRPDPELGQLLRECLTAPDPDGFVRRVRAALGGAPENSWEVLARWVRPGLAAAVAAIALAVGLWIGSGAERPDVPTLADAIEPAGAPSGLFAGAPPSAGSLVAAAEGP